jgi:hypothetical protein
MIKLLQGGRSTSLSPLYDGPYTVVRKTRAGTYVLKDESNELLHREYVPFELKVVTIDESAIEEELYEVEEIRDHKDENGQRLYLVKWVGYGERENDWLPQSVHSPLLSLSKNTGKRLDISKATRRRKVEKHFPKEESTQFTK